MQTAKQLCDQALQLPPEERMALVDQILDTLDERDSSLDAQWAQEAQSRLAAYRRGDLLEKRRPMMADWAEFLALSSPTL